MSETSCTFTSPKEKYRPNFKEGAVIFNGNQFLECNKAEVLGAGEYTKIAVVEFSTLNKKNNILSSGIGHAHALYMGDSAYPQLWHSHYRFNYSLKPVEVNKKVIILASYGDGRVENLIYLNNDLSATTPDKRAYEDPKLEIGSHGAGNFLHGSIFEIKVFNKSLNSRERKEVLNDLMTKHKIN
jgi:hypothetical protein